MGADERLDAVEVQLDGGQVALLQVYRLDGSDAWMGGGERDAARLPKPDLAKIAAVIREITAKVGDAVQGARPHSATVELALAFAFAVKAGTATAMLVDADTTASVKVTLTWTNPPANPPDRPAAAAG